MTARMERQMTQKQQMMMGLLMGCVVGVLACNSHPLTEFEPQVVSERLDRYEASETSKVDVLWVVDNSSSMCEEQKELRENFEAFVEEMASVKADFQLAVVTTDTFKPDQSGRFQNEPKPFEEGRGSCSVEVDISHCPTDGIPLVIRSSDARYQTEGELDIDKMKRDFGCSATTGTQGSTFEMGLEAARMALQPALLNSHNAGFLRDDAYLAVIFVTDENDCSNPGTLEHNNGGECEWGRDLLTPVEEYVEFFKSLKANGDNGDGAERLIMAGIYAPDDGIRYGQGENPQPSCQNVTAENGAVSKGFSGYRYDALLSEFAFSYKDNICNPPFDRSLKAIGELIVDAISDRCLQELPPTCEDDSDCDGSCVQRGQHKFCEDLKIQVELEREMSLPEGFSLTSARSPAPGECVDLGGQETYRCVLEEDEDYEIDYEATCNPTGVSVQLRRSLSTGEALGIRYARVRQQN